MRAIFLFLLMIGVVQLPFARSDDKQNEPVRMPRRISVDQMGTLDAKRVEKADVPIFCGNGRDWFLERKDDKWLIATRVEENDEKRAFLAFDTSRDAAVKQAFVVLKKEPDESCLWDVEVDEKALAKNPKASTRFWYATATKGDFQGWYLSAGEPTKVNNDIVLERAAILSKQKSAKSRLRVWEDGR